MLSAALGPGITQPLTEMSIGSRQIMFLESRARPVRRDVNLTAICEPIVYDLLRGKLYVRLYILYEWDELMVMNAGL
jgi:hypothetical protein